MAVMCTVSSERRLINVICGKQIGQADGLRNGYSARLGSCKIWIPSL